MGFCQQTGGLQAFSGVLHSSGGTLAGRGGDQWDRKKGRRFMGANPPDFLARSASEGRGKGGEFTR